MRIPSFSLVSFRWADVITGRPRSSKLLPVPAEYGHLCGGEGGRGRDEEGEEEGDKKEEGRVVVMLHGERAKRMGSGRTTAEREGRRAEGWKGGGGRGAAAIGGGTGVYKSRGYF